MLVRTMTASGTTAPDGSDTVPRMLPVLTWPYAVRIQLRITKAKRVVRMRPPAKSVAMLSQHPADYNEIRRCASVFARTCNWHALLSAAAPVISQTRHVSLFLVELP